MVNFQFELFKSLHDMAVPVSVVDKIVGYLDDLRNFDEYKWEHSIEVGLLGKKVAQFAYSKSFKPSDLAIPGFLHDIGVVKINKEIVQKTNDSLATYTKEDHEEMKEHVIEGYNMIKDDFPFYSRVILYHHKLTNGYPEILPPPKLGEEKLELRAQSRGRLISLLDWKCAINRDNSKYADLDFDEKKAKFLNEFSDYKLLINNLYDSGIFKD